MTGIGRPKYFNEDLLNDVTKEDEIIVQVQKIKIMKFGI